MGDGGARADGGGGAALCIGAERRQSLSTSRWRHWRSGDARHEQRRPRLGDTADTRPPRHQVGVRPCHHRRDGRGTARAHFLGLIRALSVPEAQALAEQLRTERLDAMQKRLQGKRFSLQQQKGRRGSNRGGVDDAGAPLESSRSALAGGRGGGDAAASPVKSSSSRELPPHADLQLLAALSSVLPPLTSPP